MKEKVFSVRLEQEEFNKAKLECSKNMTSIQIQIKEFVRRLANGEMIEHREGVGLSTSTNDNSGA